LEIPRIVDELEGTQVLKIDNYLKVIEGVTLRKYLVLRIVKKKKLKKCSDIRT